MNSLIAAGQLRNTLLITHTHFILILLLFIVPFSAKGSCTSPEASEPLRWSAIEQILQFLEHDPENIDNEFLKDSGTRALIKKNIHKCSYDPSEMDSVDQMIDILWDATQKTFRPHAEIVRRADARDSLSASQREDFKKWTRIDPSFVLGVIKTRSCRSYLQWQIDLGANPTELRDFIVHVKSCSP